MRPWVLANRVVRTVQVVGADIVDPAMQPGNLGGALTVAPRAFRAARPCTAGVPQLFERSLERSWIGHLFNHLRRRLSATVARRRTPTSTPTREPGSATLRLLRALDQDPHTRIQPGAVDGAPRSPAPAPDLTR